MSEEREEKSTLSDLFGQLKRIQTEKTQTEENKKAKLLELFARFKQDVAAVFEEAKQASQANQQFSLKSLEESLSQKLTGKFIEVLALPEFDSRHGSFLKRDSPVRSGFGRSIMRGGLSKLERLTGHDFQPAFGANHIDFQFSSSRPPQREEIDFVQLARDLLAWENNDGTKKRSFDKESIIAKRKQAAAERKKAERNEQAMHILDICPYLSVEQCVRALEMHHDNLEQAMQWVLEQSPDELLDLLAPVPEPSADNVAEGSDANNELAKQEFQIRERTNPLDPTLLLRVERVFIYTVEISQPEDVLMVEAKSILNRHRFPMHPDQAPTYLIPLADLDQRLEFCVLGNEQAEAMIAQAVQKRPVITFQVLSQHECCPLHMVPELNLNEYKLDFDPANNTLRNVFHLKDGAIQFEAVLDESFGHFSDSPIELFTEAIDAETHNIVHMHINDIREDVTFSVANLTGSELDSDIDASLHSAEFRQDSAGRMLSYRVVVRDGSVQALIYKQGSRLLHAPFVEHQLPSVGSLLSLSEGSDTLAKLKQIPTYLMVATRPREDLLRPASQALARNTCCHRHPSDLDGQVEVEIVFEQGSWLRVPRVETHPICSLRLASPEQVERHDLARQRVFDELIGQFQQALSVFEENVSNNNKREVEQMRKHVLNLQTELYQVGLDQQAEPQRVKRAVAASRAFALQASRSDA